jgi:hypothetical protein
MVCGQYRYANLVALITVIHAFASGFFPRLAICSTNCHMVNFSYGFLAMYVAPVFKAALQKTRSEQAAASQSKRTQINFTPSKALPANPYDKVVSRHSSRFHPYSRPR